MRVWFEGDAVHTNGDPARVRRLFDLDLDPAAMHATLARDAMLAPLLRKRPGIRVPGAWDPFELAVRAIVGQQVSVAGARTILGRIAAAHGFDPAVHAEVTLEGMPRKRAETIRNLARAVVEGEVTLAATPLRVMPQFSAGSLADERHLSTSAGDSAPDARNDTHVPRAAVRPPAESEFVTKLRQLPGIGPWTANYIAMRLGDRDAFPAGDLILRRHAGNLTERELLRKAENWRPYRAYAAMLLWTGVDA